MEREPEVLLAVVFLMVVGEGVRNQAATREQKAGLCTVRPMVAVGDVNSLVVLKVQKVAQIFVEADSWDLEIGQLWPMRDRGFELCGGCSFATQDFRYTIYHKSCHIYFSRLQ